MNSGLGAAGDSRLPLLDGGQPIARCRRRCSGESEKSKSQVRRPLCAPRSHLKGAPPGVAPLDLQPGDDQARDEVERHRNVQAQLDRQEIIRGRQSASDNRVRSVPRRREVINPSGTSPGTTSGSHLPGRLGLVTQRPPSAFASMLAFRLR